MSKKKIENTAIWGNFGHIISRPSIYFWLFAVSESPDCRFRTCRLDYTFSVAWEVLCIPQEELEVMAVGDIYTFRLVCMDGTKPLVLSKNSPSKTFARLWTLICLQPNWPVWQETDLNSQRNDSLMNIHEWNYIADVYSLQETLPKRLLLAGFYLCIL